MIRGPQITGSIEQRDIFVKPRIGAGADDERQSRETLVVICIYRRTIHGDDLHRAVHLPKRIGFALLNIDDNVTGEKLGDARILDHRQRLEPCAHGLDVEKRQRILRANAARSNDFLLGQRMCAGDRDGPDGEAGNPRGIIRHAAFSRNEAGIFAAKPCTIESDGDEQQQRDECAHTRHKEKREQTVRRSGRASVRRTASVIGTENQRRRYMDNSRMDRSGGLKAFKGLPHRSQEASSTIHLTSSPNVRPAYAAISGTRDVAVMPGCVLTSRMTISPVPPGRSS